MLEKLCGFEKKWRSRGLSLEDIDYYSLPGHEDEALGEELGREFLMEAKYWYHYTFEYNINSACKALETGMSKPSPKNTGRKEAITISTSRDTEDTYPNNPAKSQNTTSNKHPQN